MANSAEKTGNPTMTDTDGRARPADAEVPVKDESAEAKGQGTKKNPNFLVRVRPPVNEFRSGDRVVTREGLVVSEDVMNELLTASRGGCELYVSEVN